MLRSFPACSPPDLRSSSLIWSLPIKRALFVVATPLMWQWLFATFWATLQKLLLLDVVFPTPLWMVLWFFLTKKKPTTGFPTLTSAQFLTSLVSLSLFNMPLPLPIPTLPPSFWTMATQLDRSRWLVGFVKATPSLRSCSTWPSSLCLWLFANASAVCASLGGVYHGGLRG